MKSLKIKLTPSQSGFTLLEVLIALLIVSFGMLGVAGLQLVTLKSNSSSQYRSLAVHYAQEIGERMRANNAALTTTLLRIPFTGYNSPATSKTHSSLTSFTASCKTTGCTPGQQALNDLAEWQQGIATSFPNGIGIVCIDSGTINGPNGISGEISYNGNVLAPNCDGLGDTFVVKIAWLDNRTTDNNGAADLRAYQSFNTTLSPVGP
jgi:type IV pilus assembly protein PilV